MRGVASLFTSYIYQIFILGTLEHVQGKLMGILLNTFKTMTKSKSNCFRYKISSYILYVSVATTKVCPLLYCGCLLLCFGLQSRDAATWTSITFFNTRVIAAHFNDFNKVDAENDELKHLAKTTS